MVAGGFFVSNLALEKCVLHSLGKSIILLVTGGIHMDGYMDTMDALHSYGSRAKKTGNLKGLLTLVHLP